MKFKFDIDSWQEIFMNITRNKSRSLLTAFGVFWGIFMLVALLGGGKGLQGLMKSNFGGFATNSGMFWAQSTSKAYKGLPKIRSIRLDMEDVARLRQIEGVEVASPVARQQASNTTYGTKSFGNVSIQGIQPSYAQVETPNLEYGRYINDVDQDNFRKSCVIGYDIYKTLFYVGNNPCGKYIQVGGVYYQVVGVLKNKESNINMGFRTSETVILPLSVVQQVFNMGKDVHMISILAAKNYKLSELEKPIKSTLKRAHNVHPDDTQAFNYFNAEAMFSMVDNLFEAISILTLLVGLGTLIAGVIGVSNITMVTVKERTTEIGIRRAIGATPGMIMRQIMSESIVLTSIAGMLGITFAVLVLQMLELGISSSTGVNTPFQISFWLAMGTVFILALLGLVAGLAPAYRAMAIKPIEAISDE